MTGTEAMGLRLKSDFTDCYDHHFAGSFREDLPHWERMSRTKRTRRSDHLLMEKVGIPVVPNGPLCDFRGSEKVVVYLDPLAHCGEHKVVEYVDAIDVDPRTHCSQFISKTNGVSFRLLMAGRLFYATQQWSSRGLEWRSNVEPEHERVGTGLPGAGFRYGEAMEWIETLQDLLCEPLIAIDFVQGAKGWLAVDLNTAPGIRGTPPEGDSKEIADMIANRWRELYR